MSRARKINPGKYTPKKRLSLSDTVRLLSKVEEDENGCWNFTGCRDRQGYGRIRIKGKTEWVHRVFYSVFKRSIPEGHEIDHKCKNRSCCNPEHLRAIPMKKNRANITRDEIPPF